MTATLERDGARADGSGQGGSAAATWGQDLAYADWIKPYLPALHAGLNTMNRYMSVPALEAGLGRYMSNPLTGYLMIIGDAVYCLAGFGRQTNWYRNILADPHVEVILPSRAFSGTAEEVLDPQERLRVLPLLLRSMGAIAAMMGMGNPWSAAPGEIARKCEGMPLVRVRATGIAAGPDDFGGSRTWATCPRPHTKPRRTCSATKPPGKFAACVPRARRRLLRVRCPGALYGLDSARLVHPFR